MVYSVAQDRGESVDEIAGVFSWAAALQYAVLVVTLLVGLLALGRALNKRIKSAAKDAVTAAHITHRALQTHNGHTAGEVIEEIRNIVCANRDLAQQSLKLGLQNREDLYEHKRVGHPSSINGSGGELNVH
jgi:hypothetical protein